jgi:hypothetical protein
LRILKSVPRRTDWRFTLNARGGMPKKDRGGVERGSEIYRDKAQRKTLKKSKRGKSGSGKKERGEEDEAAQVSELLRMKSEPKECSWLGFLDGGGPSCGPRYYDATGTATATSKKTTKQFDPRCVFSLDSIDPQLLLTLDIFTMTLIEQAQVRKVRSCMHCNCLLGAMPRFELQYSRTDRF